MKIDTLILGAYETNCYVLRSGSDAHDCLIIDTGLAPGPLLDFLRTRKLNPLAVIFTHGHADHIAGAEPLRKNYPAIKLAIHKLDAEMLTCGQSNLSFLAGPRRRTSIAPADVIVDAEGPIEFVRLTFQILHTPGHTPGGISLYSQAEGAVFTGDALFAGSIGRTDFAYGNGEQLINSVKRKLLTLPDDTVVYPGHGPTTTIANEKATNPFFSRTN